MYQKITDTLRQLGHEVWDDHVMEYGLDKRKMETAEDRRQYYVDMKRKIKQCDLMVAEVSFPSTVHVGHELTLALEYNKPVLALYQKDKMPILFWGVDFEHFLVVEYGLDNVKTVLTDSINYLNDHIDTRFNFFISPSLSHYLDWVAQTKKVPRSVYLRQLIEEDRDKNKEYFDA